MVNDYLNYHLPPERIAQRPIGKGEKRSDSRLLVARTAREGLSLAHEKFSSLPEMLQAGDLLVMNNTKVLKSRLLAKHAPSGREVELLLLRPVEGAESDEWEALAKPMRTLRPGDELIVGSETFAAVKGRTDSGDSVILAIVQPGSVTRIIERFGLIPIPPYIRGGRSDTEDQESYQTVFAQKAGSVAAPTASLHFTSKTIEAVRKKGVGICELTLHLGAASFLPVDRRFERETDRFWEEGFSIPATTLEQIIAAKKVGRRVIAVGTSVVRALETVWSSSEPLPLAAEKRHTTRLFIKPGFTFRAVDVLITNFHQPLSSHLMLVAAFLGEENVARVYQEALKKEYRFLSYGDSTILFRNC